MDKDEIINKLVSSSLSGDDTKELAEKLLFNEDFSAELLKIFTGLNIQGQLEILYLIKDIISWYDSNWKKLPSNPECTQKTAAWYETIRKKISPSTKEDYHLGQTEKAKKLGADVETEHPNSPQRVISIMMLEFIYFEIRYSYSDLFYLIILMSITIDATKSQNKKLITLSNTLGIEGYSKAKIKLDVEIEKTLKLWSIRGFLVSSRIEGLFSITEKLIGKDFKKKGFWDVITRKDKKLIEKIKEEVKTEGNLM